MSYSKLIHEYLDGQLNMVREDILFAELAKNPELRVEFNQQVQIQNVAMSDMMTISPPTDSTNAIFSSLGFSIPSNDYLLRLSPKPDNLIPLKMTFGRSVGTFFKKHATTVAAVIITASLTTGVFMLTDNRFAPAEKEQVAQLNKNIPVVTSEENSPMVAKANNAGFSVFNNRQQIRQISVNGNEATPTVTEESNERPTLSALVNKANIDMNSSHDNINLAASNLDRFGNTLQPGTNDPLMNMLNIEPAKNFNDGNIAFIISYSDVMNSRVSVESPGKPSMYNITALYKLNDNWYFGGTFGNENFAQKFTRDLNGEQLEYQMNENMYYFGLVLRGAYSLENLFSNWNLSEVGKMLVPYGQMFVGVGLTNYIGMVNKAQIGMTIAPYSRWSFNVGYDFGMYVYKVDKLETTIKDGLVFGAGLSF